MLKLGITGGIGSGKSTISKLLELFGIPVYIADIESKKLTATSPIIKSKLIELFGEDLYTNNTLDKKKLASYIFTNRIYLEQVNSIIHPEIEKDFNNWLKYNESYPILGHEAAIMFESGFDKLMDKIVTVYTPLELRIKRTMLRDKANREEIINRINNQMSDEEKCKLSDYSIINDGSTSLIKQVQTLIIDLQK